MIYPIITRKYTQERARIAINKNFSDVIVLII